MEDIFTQKINYAIISHVRNYCNLDEKDSFEFMGVSRFRSGYSSEKDIYKQEELIKGWHRGRRFFIDDKHFTYANYTPHERSKFIKSYYTTKERHIKNNYNNPFASIEVVIEERSIRKHGDKITIKLYSMKKKRGVNSKYFKKSMTVSSVTFNLVTGNFTTLRMVNYSKIHTKEFRTNSFMELNKVFRRILHNGSPVKLYATFSSETFRSEIIEAFNFSNIDENDEYLTIPFIEQFVKGKKIKVPNLYYKLIERYYPTEKYLKKNDRKLVQSILDKHGIKSKITNKIFHENIDLCLDTLVHLCNMFGNDYAKHIGNIKNLPNRLKRSIRTYVTAEMIEDRRQLYQLTDVQKENIVKIITTTDRKIDELIREIFDHFDMIKKIRQEGVVIEFKSTNYLNFKSEHADLSTIISSINKGYETRYKFKPATIESIEEPIGEMYPFILKRDYDYTEEGSYIHHCVAGYSDRDSSVIISLRSASGEDRVTCEFYAPNGSLIQSKYFSNTKPPEQFVEPLRILCEKVENIAKKGNLKSVTKEKVPLIINGVEIVPKPKTNIFDQVLNDEFNAVLNF